MRCQCHGAHPGYILALRKYHECYHFLNIAKTHQVSFVGGLLDEDLHKTARRNFFL